MSTQNICFSGEIRKIICGYLLLSGAMGSNAGLGGSVGCTSDWRAEGCRFDPCRGRQRSFMEIDHEIFSTVILSLPLIQGGQLSVSGERLCTTLVHTCQPLRFWHNHYAKLGKITHYALK